MNTKRLPVVSVIMPVYNGAQYIRGAIESILNQTFKDFEIIVVDDGSTDGTYAAIEPWIKDGTIVYVHQANTGVSAARNNAIRLAKGEFLKFLDNDDFLYPKQLELQVRHLENKPINIISVSDVEYEFKSKTLKQMKITLGKMSQLARFILGNLGPPHIYLVRRSMIEKIGGFDEELSSCEDSDFWLRVILQGGIVEKLDYLGCRYRILEGSLDADMDKGLRNYCKVFDKLNQALLPQTGRLPDDVLNELLIKNVLLIHRCFKKKIQPVSYLPNALKMNQFIYQNKKTGLKRLLFSSLGAQNIALLKYIKAYLTNRDYYDKLNAATWRDERNYV